MGAVGDFFIKRSGDEERDDHGRWTSGGGQVDRLSSFTVTHGG